MATLPYEARHPEAAQGEYAIWQRGFLPFWPCTLTAIELVAFVDSFSVWTVIIRGLLSRVAQESMQVLLRCDSSEI